MKTRLFIFFFLGLGILTSMGYLNVPLIWDDYELFHLSSLLNAKNPFVYWLQDSGQTKAWPFSYSVLWVLKWISFSDHYEWLRWINIALHSLNGILFYSVLKRLKLKLPTLFAAVFVFHPLHSETLFWVIQINTLLSVFLFLGSVLLLIKTYEEKHKISFVMAQILFLFSVAAKPVTACAGLIVAIPSFRKQSRLAKVAILTTAVMFLVVGLYFTDGTLRGIHLNRAEESRAKNFIVSTEQSQHLKYIHEQLSIQPSEEWEKMDWGLRWTAAFNAFSFYVEKTFWPTELLIFYPKNFHFDWFSIMGFLWFLGMFVAFGWSYKLTQGEVLRLWITVVFIGFIPVSTLFYIPYMKFSLVSNHWGYLMTAGLIGLAAVILSLLRERILKLLLSVAAVAILVLCYHSSQEFAEPGRIFDKNIKANPHSVMIPAMAAQHFKNKGDQNKYCQYLGHAVALNALDTQLQFEFNNSCSKSQ